MKYLAPLLVLIVALAFPAAAQAVTVETVTSDFDFAEDGVLVVRFDVTDAAGLTGLEFSIVYPSNLLAVERDNAVGGVLNIACGASFTVKDLYERLAGILGFAEPARHEPPRAGDVKMSSASIERAREGLGFEPVVGYAVTDEVSVGAGLIYRYREDSRFSPSLSTNDYGGSLFVRYRFHPNVFLQGEYEYLSYEFRQFDGSTEREDFGSVLGGLGYSQPIGPRSSFFASALYNFSYDSNERSPYDSPWVVRFGIGVSF